MVLDVSYEGADLTARLQDAESHACEFWVGGQGDDVCERFQNCHDFQLPVVEEGRSEFLTLAFWLNP